MALFFQYQQCNFSHPIRLQFLWKDGREILALKASLRISLSNGLESFGIHLQCERFESAKARTGNPFGTVVQIQKGANEDHTLKSLEFVSPSLYVKDARKKINRLLLKPASVRVSARVRHSCMHLQRALRLSI